MVRTMFTKFSAGAAVALATLAWTSQAQAFHHHRWHGSSGGWGSSGGSWGGSSGGYGGWGSSGGSWGGSWGGYGGHGHWRWGGSSGGWGSSGGSSGGGYWGGSSGGWGSSGGSSGGTYYYAPGVVPDVQMTPVDPSVVPPAMAPPAGAPPAAPAPALPPAPGTSTSNTRADGLLSVSVPEDAKIFVNGQATSSTGAARQYVSRDLRTGYNYTYEVRAEAVRDGRTVEQVKKIDLRAGETANLAFDFPATDSVETSLTLHVPADAKVYLAGNATKANGETRVFRTTGLSGSKSWDGYTIRVELERGGRTLTKEETINLKAGQSQELQFDFEGDKVASSAR